MPHQGRNQHGWVHDLPELRRFQMRLATAVPLTLNNVIPALKNRHTGKGIVIPALITVITALNTVIPACF